MQGGVEIQPMSQKWRHGGGQPGRASITGSPDSGGIHSLIGVIDTSRLLRYFFVCPKRACIFPIPNYPLGLIDDSHFLPISWVFWV